MAKGFKQNNPLENLVGVSLEQEEQKKEIAESQPEPKEKKKLKYLRLDITDYYDYVSLMVDYMTNTSGKSVSMTKYILQLIEADKQQNLEKYQRLQQIEQMKQRLI